MKVKVIAALSVASLAFAFSACGGAANTNTANKAANAANTATNTAGNMTNTAVNATKPGSATDLTASTDGNIIKIEEAGIQVSAPRGFKIQKDGETTNLISPDDAFEVYFHIPKNDDYDKALEEVTMEIENYIKDIKVTGDAEKGDFGGIPATMFSGTGIDKEDGKAIDWELIVLDAPKKPVLVVSYADQGSSEKYAKEISEIAKSIKKL